MQVTTTATTFINNNHGIFPEPSAGTLYHALLPMAQLPCPSQHLHGAFSHLTATSEPPTYARVPGMCLLDQGGQCWLLMSSLTFPNVGHRLSRTSNSIGKAALMATCSPVAPPAGGGLSQQLAPCLHFLSNKSTKPNPALKQMRLKSGRTDAEISPRGKVLLPITGKGSLWYGLQDLQGPRVSAVSSRREFSTVWGEMKEEGQGPGLDPRLIISPKSPNHTGGNPLLFCGVMCHTGDGR